MLSFSVFLFLSVSVYGCASVFLCICVFFSIYSVKLSVSFSFYLFLSLSFCVFLFLPFSLSIFLCLSLSTFFSLYLSVSLSFYPYLSLYLSMMLSVSVSFSLYFCLSPPPPSLCNCTPLQMTAKWQNSTTIFCPIGLCMQISHFRQFCQTDLRTFRSPNPHTGPFVPHTVYKRAFVWRQPHRGLHYDQCTVQGQWDIVGPQY